ncbi:MAG: GntR family transcriptional regulator, partial [Lachnospiraceae bacterium]|nr:GntR family transcriptional regulator [Lachnospiraceae bacterium]
MNYRIDKGSKTPAYLQLYRYLRNDIVKGIYPYGDKLPSKRTMAEET